MTEKLSYEVWRESGKRAAELKDCRTLREA